MNAELYQIMIDSTEGALSIALPRDFHPSHPILPLIALLDVGATSVSDGIFVNKDIWLLGFGAFAYKSWSDFKLANKI